MAQIQTTGNAKFWEGHGEAGALPRAGGNAKWRSHFRRQFGDFLQNYTYSYHRIQQSDSLVLTQMS